MVHLWKISDDYSENLLGVYDRDLGPDRFGFKQGKECQTPSERPTFRFSATLESIGSKSDLGNDALVPLVNSQVAAILNEVCADDVQLIPANVVAKDGSSDDYSIVVVTKKVRGLDHAKSSYKCVPGTESIMRFDRAVYEEGCLGTNDAARDEEYFSNLLISEHLYDALREFGDMGLYPQTEVSWTA